MRTAVEKGKLVIALPQTRELPWLEKSSYPADAKVITDPAQALLAAGASEATSDTGELTRDWERGTYTINTQRSQGVAGWIGGRTLKLADAEFSVSTRNASVMVQSMDGKAIRASSRILLSMGARSTPASEQRLPFYSEPVVGQFSLRAPAGLRLYRRDHATGEERALPVAYRDGRYLINLDGSLKTYWLTLK